MKPTYLSTRLAAALAMCCVMCASALGQSQATTFGAAEREAALSAIAKAFEEQYVFPEMRPRIAERLKAAESSGRYGTDDPRVFAERVTEDLVEVSHDKHL